MIQQGAAFMVVDYEHIREEGEINEATTSGRIQIISAPLLFVSKHLFQMNLQISIQQAWYLPESMGTYFLEEPKVNIY